jgi:hypothetical protein
VFGATESSLASRRTVGNRSLDLKLPASIARRTWAAI